MAFAPHRWSGPLLALPGLLGIALIAWQAPGERSMIAAWILASALSLERVVPLLGLGMAVSLLGRRQCWSAPAVLLVGTAIGFRLRPWFMNAMDGVPQAADHLFLTGPLSDVAAGLLLIAPRWARAWLFVPVTMVVGAMLAVAIGLTDPTVNEILVPCVGAATGAWIVSAIALTASAFHRPWFSIAARIAGSWLLAAGLLYGSAALVPRPAAPAQPVLPRSSPRKPPFDGLGNGSPGLDLSPRWPAKPADPHV
ncbi:MAG: hypothetical protein AB7S92_07620 [Parvibaculaceae bacterium]